MQNDDSIDLNKSIKVVTDLIQKANSADSTDALRFTQAALNAANAIIGLTELLTKAAKK